MAHKRRIESTGQTAPASLLRECREASGFADKAKASKQAGITYSTLYRYEEGQQSPTVAALAEVLDKMGWELTLVAVRR